MTSASFLKKFLDPAQIAAAITEVAALAKKQNIPIALIGGAAMQLIGSDRLTKDVDFVAPAVPAGIKRNKSLSFGGIQGKTASGLPVDIVVRSDNYGPLYVESLKKAVKVGLPVRVVPPEYLAAMKLAARRSKDEEDLKRLIESGELDVKKTKDVIGRHLGQYAVDEFVSYIDEVEWLKSQKRR